MCAIYYIDIGEFVSLGGGAVVGYERPMVRPRGTDGPRVRSRDTAFVTFVSETAANEFTTAAEGMVAGAPGVNYYLAGHRPRLTVREFTQNN